MCLGLVLLTCFLGPSFAPRGVGGAGWNFFGLCSGWGFLEGQMWSTGVHTEVLPQIQIASLEGPSGSWGYPGSP